MKEVKVGMIQGRHEMPVESYIFDGALDPMDFNAIEAGVVRWIDSLSDYVVRDEDEMFPYYPVEGRIHVTLYVTGLSAVLACVAKYCAKCHIGLTLMHFDRDTGDYKPQEIF